MQVLKNISIDMAIKTAPVVIHTMQGDVNTRFVKANLFSNSVPWVVPEDVVPSIAFKNLKDHHNGWYDELPDGSKAASVTGNVVVLTLAPSVVSSAGDVSVAIVFQNEKLDQLATFPFLISVEQNPAFGESIINDYYKYSTMEAVSEAVDAALSELETSKQDFFDKAVEALEVVKGAATEDAPAIICEETGEIISVSDSSNRTLAGLTIYGKTTQNGTPTPESPVELVSAGASGVINTTVFGGNLLDYEQLKQYDGNILQTTIDNDGYMTIINNTGNRMYPRFVLTGYKGKLYCNIEIASKTGSASIYASNFGDDYSSLLNTVGTKFFVKEVDGYFRFMAVMTSGDTIKFRAIVSADGKTEWEPYKGQTLTASTPNGLPGVPLGATIPDIIKASDALMAGVWWDEETQQYYISDTIDYARGVYVQRVDKPVYDESNGSIISIASTNTTGKYRFILCQDAVSTPNNVAGAVLSNILPTVSADQTYLCNNGICVNSAGEVVLYVDALDASTKEEALAWLKEKKAEFSYALATPTETALSDEELTAYATLHTNKSNTTVYNDAGAGLKLEYNADTKAYIDNKFTELQNAILSAGANI